MSENKSLLHSVSEFAGKSLFGFLVFFIIAVPAIGISFFVKYLETIGLSPYLVSLLTFLDYAIVTVDALAFFYHLLYSLYALIKEMNHA